MTKAKKLLEQMGLTTGSLWPADNQLHQSRIQARRETRELIKSINAELPSGSQLKLNPPDAEINSHGGDITG